jgi:hypothetical protein
MAERLRCLRRHADRRRDRRHRLRDRTGHRAYGYGASGTGVKALSSSGTGLFAQTFGLGSGVQASASAGSAIVATNSSGNSNPAVYGHDANGNGGDFQESYIGVLGRAGAGGFPLVATDLSSNNLFYGRSGNVSYKGGLFHFASIAAGATVKSLTPQYGVADR